MLTVVRQLCAGRERWCEGFSEGWMLRYSRAHMLSLWASAAVAQNGPKSTVWCRPVSTH